MIQRAQDIVADYPVLDRTIKLLNACKHRWYMGYEDFQGLFYNIQTTDYSLAFEK